MSAHIHVCVHILCVGRGPSHIHSLSRPEWKPPFGPAFSAVTTITKGEPGSPDSACAWEAVHHPAACPLGPLLHLLAEPCLPPLWVGTTSYPIPDQVTPDSSQPRLLGQAWDSGRTDCWAPSWSPVPWEPPAGCVQEVGRNQHGCAASSLETARGSSGQDCSPLLASSSGLCLPRHTLC